MKALLLLLALAGTSLAQNPLPTMNQKAPELTLQQGLQTPGEQAPTLASLHGRLVVLEFWATWCGRCVVAIPHLNDIAEQVKDQPVTFLSISDEDPAIVKAFLTKRPMRSWIGIDRDGTTFARYGVEGRPQALLIDGNGVLRAALQPEQVNRGLLTDALAGKYPVSEGIPEKPAKIPMEYAPGVPPPLLQVLIRPAAPPAVSGFFPGREITAPGGRIEDYGISLGTLLYYAMNDTLRSDRIIAPPWFGTNRYDVSVAVPAGRDDLRAKLLMQAAIDTFALKMHREQRPAEVYVLSSAGVPKLKLSSAKPSRGFAPHPGAFSGVGTNIQNLTGVLSRKLNDIEVVDETGLTGNYDFDLAWQSKDEMSLASALHDQLGLTLTRQTRNREFLVVDDAVEPQTAP